MATAEVSGKRHSMVTLRLGTSVYKQGIDIRKEIVFEAGMAGTPPKLTFSVGLERRSTDELGKTK